MHLSKPTSLRVRMLAAAGLASLSLAAQAAVQLDVTVDPMPQPLYQGTVTPVTVTIRNTGSTPMAAGDSIYISTPREMEFTAMPAGCTSRTGAGTPNQYVDCPFPAIAAGDSTQLVFQALARDLYPTATYQPGGGPDLRFDTEIDYDDGTGTMVSGKWPNGASPFYIDPRPAGGGGAGVTAVPTMDAWGLGIMAALLGAAAARRRQKKKAD